MSRLGHGVSGLFLLLTLKKLLVKLNSLIKEISRTPFKGIGKPEPLKGDLSGLWSRRINREHRIVYRVQGGGVANCTMSVSLLRGDACYRIRFLKVEKLQTPE